MDRGLHCFTGNCKIFIGDIVFKPEETPGKVRRQVLLPLWARLQESMNRTNCLNLCFLWVKEHA